ncbi:DUF2252 family protein [Tardiphaga sp.]|jgi:hypothetical protein|uniref:DUF2252 family protein n=1 Tax=Tardiphaga sp. TaxID=1926292 RepID=UPI0037DA3B04
MSIVEDTRAYESWLRRRCIVIDDDLAYKHERMQRSPFIFLRATYYRWARRIETLCPQLKSAPRTLCVGDIHLENFGTWRDADGRWVWGVNDFDEAAVMPYAFDLVRLATSVQLAPKMKLDASEIAEAILDGYREGISEPGPALLDDDEIWIRSYVGCSDQCRRDFWDEIDDLEAVDPPPLVRHRLMSSFPPGAGHTGFFRRVAGGGSLGRPRFVGVAEWRSGRVVREAKALVPSAWHWAHRRKPGAHAFLYLATGLYRSPDPHLRIEDNFILRRLAADTRKINLGKRTGDEIKRELLKAMGSDLASIHAATHGASSKIKVDLEARHAGWLKTASRIAATANERDYDKWCRI